MHTTLLLAAAVPAKETPLIDFDLTVLIQLVVFLLTALILSRFLFKPFLAMRAARSEGIEGAREQATRMDDEARAKIADYEVRFAKARTRANDERAKVRAEATNREREITDAARKETEVTLDAARRTLDKDAEGARQALAPRADEIARSIVKKVLGREVA